MQKRDERKDVLMNEAAVMAAIWNLQISSALESPDIPFDRLGVTLTQKQLIEYIDRIGLGHAAFERACNRLCEIGRLHRQRANPRRAYTYHVSHDAMGLMMFDLALWGAPMIRQDEQSRIIEIEVIEPGNIKAAGKSLNDFFGFGVNTDKKTPK